MSGAHTTNSEIAGYLRDICPEFGDLDEEELLLLQESAYLHIKNSHGNRDAVSGSQETSYSSWASVHENESWNDESIQKQMAHDEALARALEFEDDFNEFHINDDHDEFSGNAHPHTESTQPHTESTQPQTESTQTHMESSTRSGQSIRNDDGVNPDTMSYEELSTLGDSVGSVSKGLPADTISRLPSFTYKVGFFSKKKKDTDECVICCTQYKNGAKVIALPCAHQYHQECITPWLQDNKHCPMCKKEVLNPI